MSLSRPRKMTEPEIDTQVAITVVLEANTTDEMWNFTHSSAITCSHAHKLPLNRCRVNRTRSSAIAEGPRDASCQLKFCQLPRNRAETTCTTSPEQIEVMMLDGYSGTVCNR